MSLSHLLYKSVLSPSLCIVSPVPVKGEYEVLLCKKLIEIFKVFLFLFIHSGKGESSRWRTVNLRDLKEK